MLITTRFNAKKITFYENTIGYLKNHWTKYRLASIHFDAFYMLVPNLGMIFNNSDIFEILGKKFLYFIYTYGESNYL